MQLNLSSGESLKAVLSGAPNSVAPKVKVDYLEDGRPKTVWVTLAAAAVVLLAGAENATRVVTGLSCLNTDDATVTVTFTHVTTTTTNTIDAKTLLVSEKLFYGVNGPQVTDSSGNVKLAFASSATTFTGDITLSGGKDVIFSGTTGQPEIQVPDNLADALSVKITDGADLLQFDTSTGAIVINVGATVRWNVLGSAQIGNATADLVAFHGATPTDQCAAYTQTFSTADRTHAARTATALTVTDGAGTNDGTIGAITADASVIEAVQELAAMLNKVIVDLAATAGVVNAVVDDLQEKGLVG